MKERKKLLTLVGISGLIGGLCCLTPIVLILLGISTVSFAAELGDVLYWEYRWVFRILGLGTLIAAFVFYYRSRGICTLDHVKRNRNKIFNTSLLVLISAVGIYTVWTYVILHHWGVAVGLPW